LYPEMYERLITAARKTNADIAVCGYLYQYPDRDVTIDFPFMKDCFLDRTYIKESVAPFMLGDSALNSLWNKIIRRDVVIKNDIRLCLGQRYGEDRDFFLKCLASSNGICFISYTGYFYRRVPTGAIQKARRDYVDTMIECAQKPELYTALGVDEKTAQAACENEKAKQLLSSIAFTERNFKGKERREALKAIMNDERVKSMTDAVLNPSFGEFSRFDRLIAGAVNKKSLFSLRLYTKLMKLRVSLYGLLRREKEE
ncbi:MAG: hypothetical protein K6F09_05950, partial [Clostridiales bacterium]|nr:hypothetical protein [Clostridiales bacterium]